MKRVFTRTRWADRFRGYDFTVQEWDAICAQYDNRCADCGASGFLTVDHALPVAAGGTDDLSNIRPLCTRCNCKKGDGGETRRQKQLGLPRINYRPVYKPPLKTELSAIARELLEELARKLGVSQTAIMEIAIRKMAANEGVTKGNE